LHYLGPSHNDPLNPLITVADLGRLREQLRFARHSPQTDRKSGETFKIARSV